MKTKLIMILGVVTLMALSQVAWAGQGYWNNSRMQRGAGMGMGMGMGMGCGNGQVFPAHLLPMMTVALELNAEQVEKITTLNAEFRNTFTEQRDLKTEQRTLMTALQPGATLDVQALRRDLAALKEREVDLLVKRAQLREELTQVLTAEQRGKCQALMTSMQPMRPRRGMAPDGPAGPGGTWDRRGPGCFR